MFIVKSCSAGGTYLWTTKGRVSCGLDEAKARVSMIEFTSEDGDSVMLNIGSAYIMNADGRTVEQYHFTPAEPTP